jgi:hypothetical protein
MRVLILLLKFAYILAYKICGKRLFIKIYKFSLRKLFNFNAKKVQEIWQILSHKRSETNTHIARNLA